MQEAPKSREMRVAIAGDFGHYVLAVMPRLTNQELVHFPKQGGIRAEAIVNHEDESQFIVFRKTNFSEDQNKQCDQSFIDFAANVALHYGVEKFNSNFTNIENWRHPTIS
jgi:hypothetical protein